MNLERLYEILQATTIQLRKGDAVERSRSGNLVVTSVDFNPPVSEARPDLELVDMELLTIGVDKEGAQRHKAELIEIMNQYPNPERLKSGPSYIEVGGEIGDQGAAFQLFALGKVLGLWNVITPRRLMKEPLTAEQENQLRELCGRGFIMIDGYRTG